MPGTFRFSFGPWNIHEGSDPFGPTVRPGVAFAEKLRLFKGLGFDGVQFHDDDAVPQLDKLTGPQIAKAAAEVKRALDGEGLAAEFVAPRLWEDPRGVDGAYTANDKACRKWARERSRICIDIANALGTRLIVLWLAREGTYVRESKDSAACVDLLVEALNDMLSYDKHVRIAIEPKPNEPVDHAFIPTAGHGLALASRTVDPGRVGINVESAHAVLAGLDPSDEMAFALSFGRLFSVHLNDQNGLKFDQDKSFGSVDLRRALSQVSVLDRHDYGSKGEFVGLDVKAMRTQPAPLATKHLANSRAMFTRLLKVSRSLDRKRMDELVAQRDYEGLEMLVLSSLTAA